MRSSKLILATAALALMTALAGCGGDPATSDDQTNNSTTDQTDDSTPGNPSSKTYTVTFVSNGGNAVASQAVAEGGKATEPAAPTRSGYTFAGWFTDNDTFASVATFPYTVTADITFYAKWLLNASGGTGVIEIRTAADLYNVRDNLSGNYILMNDISLKDYSTGEGWKPISGFTGKLNGNGYKITDLTISTTSFYIGVGLFSDIEGGSVSNLGVEIAADGVKGSNCVGSIAGYVYIGTITNCYSTGGGISSNGSAGGIVGSVNGSKVIDCYSMGNISSISSVSSCSGGIVGSANDNSIITNCCSAGNISSSTSSPSFATSYVSSSGGIVGVAASIIITNCYSTGSISSSSSPFADFSGYIAASGGIAGYVSGDDNAITNCYSTGNIASYIPDIHAGTTTSASGGIVGYAYLHNNNAITSCVAINLKINGSGYNGRIVGFTSTSYGSDNVTISNNLALNTMIVTENQSWATNGVGKTADDFLLQDTYQTGLGWDFVSTWKMSAGGGYPILYWQ